MKSFGVQFWNRIYNGVVMTLIGFTILLGLFFLATITGTSTYSNDAIRTHLPLVITKKAPSEINNPEVALREFISDPQEPCQEDWRTCYPRISPNRWNQIKDLKTSSVANALSCKLTSYGSRMAPISLMKSSKKRLLFVAVIGVEGSGSTWMHRLIPSHKVPNSVSKGVGKLLHDLWSNGPLVTVAAAQARFVKELQKQVTQFNRSITSIHVSCPDWDGAHYPDLHSSFWQGFREAGLDFKIIAMFRDPKESAYSNYHRRWPHIFASKPGQKGKGSPDIVASARSTERHLTLLSAQINSLPPEDVLVVHYEAMLDSPVSTAWDVANFLGLPNSLYDVMLGKMRGQGRRDHAKFRHQLTANQVQFLDLFFDDQRSSKWLCMERRAAWVRVS